MTRIIKRVVKHSNGFIPGVWSRSWESKKNKKKSEKINSKSEVVFGSRCRELESKRLKRWIRSRKNLNVEVGVRCRSWKNRNPGVEALELESGVGVKVLSPSQQRNNYELGTGSRVKKLKVEVGVGSRSRINCTTQHSCKINYSVLKSLVESK